MKAECRNDGKRGLTTTDRNVYTAAATTRRIERRRRREWNEFRTLITFSLRTQGSSQWLNLSFCLPTFNNDPTKWLKPCIGYIVVYLWRLSRSFVFLELFTLFVRSSPPSEQLLVLVNVHVVRGERSCTSFAWNVFPSNIESPCRIYVLTVTMATCFATECSLYLHVYMNTQSSSFRYDEFQDMRIQRRSLCRSETFLFVN